MEFTPAEQKILDRAARILDKHLKCRDIVFESPTAVRDYLRIKLEARESEVFALMFLDSRNRLIEYKEMFFGTIDGASVYPREVVKAALAANAAACFLVHNHPSGIAEPSQADIRLTEGLKNALALVDVRVLDHFVVGARSIASLAELGIM